MYTWTSNRIPLRAAALASVLALAGCMGEGGGAMSFAAPPPASAQPPASLVVAGGDVVVAGPRGFCIDRDASRDDPEIGALVVLGDCRALGGRLFGPRPAAPAMLTAALVPGVASVTVATAGEAMVAYFPTPEGRAMLARTGRAEDVTILSAEVDRGVVVLHLTDSGAFAGGTVADDYWRAIMDAGGRMVTVSVYSAPDLPLDAATGRTLLRDFVAALHRATVRRAAGSG